VYEISGGTGLAATGVGFGVLAGFFWAGDSLGIKKSRVNSSRATFEIDLMGIAFSIFSGEMLWLKSYYKSVF
jgi:hypothetical protein